MDARGLGLALSLVVGCSSAPHYTPSNEGGGGSTSGSSGSTSGSSGSTGGANVVQLDSAALDGNGNPAPVYTPQPLTAGAGYQVEVFGDFSIWDADTWASDGVCPGATPESNPDIASPGVTNADTSLDAEYLYGAPSGTQTYCPNGSPSVTFPHGRRAILFDLGSGFGAAPLPQESTFQAGHLYHYLVTGTGAPLGLEMGKAGTYGQFRVTVTPSP
jgi:hypothetical protein